MSTSPEGDPPISMIAAEERTPFAWAARLMGTALAWYLRFVAATSRFPHPEVNQEQTVFAVWHESNLAAATASWRLRHDRHFVSFSTRGFRGIMMNAMLRAMGCGVVTLPEEGRATRAEAGRLSLELARVAREGRTVVVSCDGPFGPYRKAKPGVLLVAREAAVPIQPWAVSVRPTLRLRGRWDRHLVPLPFSRIRVWEGDLISVGPRTPLKPLLARLQGELDRVAGLADARMAGEAPGE